MRSTKPEAQFGFPRLRRPREWPNGCAMPTDDTPRVRRGCDDLQVQVVAARPPLSRKTGCGLGCGWHLGDPGILERDDLPLVLFLYNDQRWAGIYFARLG